MQSGVLSSCVCGVWLDLHHFTNYYYHSFCRTDVAALYTGQIPLTSLTHWSRIYSLHGVQSIQCVCCNNIQPDRQWRSSSFQESKKVRVSRDLDLEYTLDAGLPGDHRMQVWSRSCHLRDLWPWPWANPGCTLTWSPSCESLVAIRPYACEKRFAQKFTDRRTDDGCLAIV